jgi:hypothetical protein
VLSARFGMRAHRSRAIVLVLVAGLVLSVVEASASSGAASADPLANAVDPREVPLLPGEPPAPEPTVPAKPDADFSPLAVRSEGHFDEERSEPVSRSTLATEFENPDGTR